MLYIMSMFSNACNIIIFQCVGAPGYGREVVDGLNEIYIFQINVYGNFLTSW